MPVRPNVFMSRPERENYLKLSRQWGDKYRVYHNLPFLNVIEVNEGQTLFRTWDLNFQEFSVSRIELGWLKKTSVDYVVCDETDRPLMAIDFDGMYQGYSRGQTYVSTAEPIYEAMPGKLGWRAEKFELMLRVAHANLFPYVVVRSRDFEYLGRSLKLMILDGVIGEVLANRALHERIASEEFRPDYYGISDEEWEEMEPDGQQLYIDDWLLSHEVAADMEHNPISHSLAELSAELGHPTGRIRPLEHKWTSNLSPSERREKWDQRPMIGAECTLSPDGSEPITRRFWITNYGVPWFSGLSLAQNIAKLIALDAYRSRMSNPARDS